MTTLQTFTVVATIFIWLETAIIVKDLSPKQETSGAAFFTGLLIVIALWLFAATLAPVIRMVS